MEPKEKRMATRSRTWPETRATIEVNDLFSLEGLQAIRIIGNVSDIGSRGMFLETEEYVPIPANARITIAFDPDSESSEHRLTATGTIVRRCEGGVGILFTSIDLGRLQKCIIARMNRGSSVNADRRYKVSAPIKLPAPDGRAAEC